MIRHFLRHAADPLCFPVTGVCLDIEADDREAAVRVAQTELPPSDPDLADVFYTTCIVHPRYPSPKRGAP